MNDLSAVGSKYVSTRPTISTRPHTASMPVHRDVLRVAGVRRNILCGCRCIRQPPPVRRLTDRHTLQLRRFSFHNRPIQLRLLPRFLFLHHDPGISVADRIFENFLRSPSGNCFDLPFRAGVSCACLVYDVPDQPTICLDRARLRSAVIPDPVSGDGNRRGGRSV